jgi:phage terminase small subunit
MADEQLEPPAKPITRRMERFCQEYLADLNGSAAARRAGVSDNSARTMQYRWLRDPRVRARIAELMREREDATRVKGYLVLEELATVALSSREHFTTDAEGNLVAKPDAPARAMAAVQKIKIKRRLVALRQESRDRQRDEAPRPAQRRGPPSRPDARGHHPRSGADDRCAATVRP